MYTKSDLTGWVLSAVRELGGSATVVKVAEHLWAHHEQDLRASGRLFYTWQYDMRWSALELRKAGELLPTNASPPGTWQLA